MRRLLALVPLLLALLLAAPAPTPAQGVRNGGVIRAIEVEGAQRIEEATIRSYLLVAPGDGFDADRLDRSLKALFATGYFADASLERRGDTLRVKVEENPLVNRVAFEGNNKVKLETLQNETQLRPRSVFTPTLARADQRRLLDIYARSGRFGATVEPKIIRLPQNRVDVVFEITEGEPTGVQRVNFIGNTAFSDSRLRDVVLTKESVWWRFLSSADSYDPDRLNVDRELLRRFYLRQGYADIQVTSAAAELTPDRRAFFVSFTVVEGERYRVGKLEVNSQLRGLDSAVLNAQLQMSTGDWFNSDVIESTTNRLATFAQNAGFPFAEARASVRRNPAERTIDMTFELVEGPRIFVDRLDIVGNVRTQDQVVRRQFRLAEGDALNQAAVQRARQRVRDLGFFESVEVTRQPGSAPDRANLTVEVQEKATGDLTIGGGFSTDFGALANLGLRERNFLGTGIDARINTLLAQRRSQVDLSVTDPAFLDRNLLGGFDVFYVVNTNLNSASFDERRVGFALRLGYEISDTLRQTWNYTYSDREIFNIDRDASRFVRQQEGKTLLSQIGQTLTYDRRDSRIDPKDGYVTRLGTDFAGIGGDVQYMRVRADGAYYQPIGPITGTDDYVLVFSGSAGKLFSFDDGERIIDRFFLGGENLRGFRAGGAGPRDTATNDSLGGTIIATASIELRFPLPVPDDFGITGRVFTDMGILTDLSDQGPTVVDDGEPRVSVGFGFGWRSPFGLVNVDLGFPIIKKSYDRTEMFRFGFGTRF